MSTTQQYVYQADGRTYTVQDILSEPATFAAEVYGYLARDGDPRVMSASSGGDFGKFHAALHALKERLTDPEHIKLLDDISDEGGDLACDSHAAGVRFGIAVEQFRRSILDAVDA